MQLEHGLEGAEHAGGAAHVVLHLVHAGGRFDADTAGVEGDALADQGEGFVVLLTALVVHDDHPWRLLAALSDGEEGAGAEFLEFLLVEDFHLEVLVGLAQGLGFFGQVAGVAEVGRQVAQVLGEGDTRGDGAGMLQAAFGIGQLGLVDDQGDLLQGAWVGFLALELFEQVAAVGQGFDDQTSLAVGIAALDLELVEGEQGIAAAQALEYAMHACNQLA